MKRRSKASGKTGTSASRKEAKPKRTNPTKFVHGRRSASINRGTGTARLARERDEALEREMATAEVLRVISSSPGELEPVFNTMLEKAIRICGAKFGNLWLREGDLFRAVAVHGAPPAYRNMLLRAAIRPGPDTGLGILLKTKRFIQIEDITKGKAYLERDPLRVATVELGGGRSLAEVPLLREAELIGSINIYHQEVKPFTKKQIELLQNFASQAVIAIENARLLNELRESLEQQTATSEVLRIIATSPQSVQPVFDAIVANAARLCEATFSAVAQFDGELLHLIAVNKMSPEETAAYHAIFPRRPNRAFIMGRAFVDGKPVHVEDIETDPDYDPHTLSALKAAAPYRTYLGIPILREGVPIGVIGCGRREVRPFTEEQIALVESFASQAVIAIENTRLLNELRESLEQQTATADVLRVISSSPEKLETVFQALLANAVRICGAGFGNLALYDGKDLRMAAMHNAPPAYEKVRGSDPVIPLANTIAGPVVALKRVNHVHDLATEEPYAQSMLARKGGARTAIGVPMLRDGVLVGMIAIYRQEVRPFTDKQIDLVKNFAAQAVIAIENARLLNELRQRTTDLSESLEQQTATSQVLGVISTSQGELEPVFTVILENAIRICRANLGGLFAFENGRLRVLAQVGVSEKFLEAARSGAYPPGPRNAISHLMETRQPIHIADYREHEAYLTRDPMAVIGVELAGIRTLLNVPMIKDGELIGFFGIFRQEVEPFSDKQISLVQNFAAQAVIAIENARLLGELRQRTDDLSEALEQQTATSEVLRVISASPGDLQPVFQAMLENASRICGAALGLLWLAEGDGFRVVALHDARPELIALLRRQPVIQPSPRAPLPRVAATKQMLHIADMAEDVSYKEGDPAVINFVKIAGARTVLMVPLVKEAEFIGAISIYRNNVQLFAEKQIDLVKNFAAQAVIAIENARLLNELRQRTDDLTESLEQQTATSRVLEVISSSQGDLKPVFEAILENATRICLANFGTIYRFDGTLFHIEASLGEPPELVEFRRRRGAFLPPSGQPLDRMMRARAVVRAVDDAAHPVTSPAAQLGGARSHIAVPMFKEGALVGAITIYRREVLPFTDKQVDLVQNFAAQAVIAIENARLLNELRQRTTDLTESLEQQTATSEVLGVISRSPGEILSVFEAILANAKRLCEAQFGILYLAEGNALRFGADVGTPPKFAEFQRQRGVFRPRLGTRLEHVMSTKEIIHTADLATTTVPDMAAVLGGARSTVWVPMLKDGEEFIGVICIYRQEVRPFTDKQIELLKNFASQAIIAIENARLLNELRQRTNDLSKSLDDLRTAQDRLVQTQKLASLGQLTAGIAHEIKNPLNFVNNFSAVSIELIDELQEQLLNLEAAGTSQVEINELAETLKGNLEKITQHGKRADSIVKNMLLHSREGSGEHRHVDVNALVEESLNLAYHGARAERQGFNITLERSFDPAAGEADLYPQEITRVLINLISNGFYAAHMRQAQRDGGFEPTLSAATRDLRDRVEIRIRDNGTGIPPDVKEKIFNPFFTTKPAGEGTGLGLSITHDIIVKQHAGTITVDSEPGQFTEFTIVLPRKLAALEKRSSGGPA